MVGDYEFNKQLAKRLLKQSLSIHAKLKKELFNEREKNGLSPMYFTILEKVCERWADVCFYDFNAKR